MTYLGMQNKQAPKGYSEYNNASSGSGYYNPPQSEYGGIGGGGY